MSKVLEDKLSRLDDDVYSYSDLKDVLRSSENVRNAIDQGLITFISEGFYNKNIPTSTEVFAIVSKYYPRAVISGIAAIFYQDLFELDPTQIEVDISADSSAINNELIKSNRIASSRIIGVEKISNNGIEVSIYNKERCLLEAVKFNDYGEYTTKAVINYLSGGDIDFPLIQEYSRLFGGKYKRLPEFFIAIRNMKSGNI